MFCYSERYFSAKFPQTTRAWHRASASRDGIVISEWRCGSTTSRKRGASVPLSARATRQHVNLRNPILPLHTSSETQLEKLPARASHRSR